MKLLDAADDLADLDARHRFWASFVLLWRETTMVPAMSPRMASTIKISSRVEARRPLPGCPAGAKRPDPVREAVR
jgi:hypothetical protein